MKLHEHIQLGRDEWGSVIQRPAILRIVWEAVHLRLVILDLMEMDNRVTLSIQHRPTSDICHTADVHRIGRGLVASPAVSAAKQKRNAVFMLAALDALQRDSIASMTRSTP